MAQPCELEPRRVRVHNRRYNFKSPLRREVFPMKMTLVAFGTALVLSSCVGAIQNTPPASTGNARAITPPSAGSYAVIYSFTGGGDGGNAETPLTFDAQGNA